MSSTTCRAATAAPEQSRHIMIEYIVDTDTDVDVEYVVETDIAIVSDGVVGYVVDTKVDVDVECVVDTVGDVDLSDPISPGQDTACRPFRKTSRRSATRPRHLPTRSRHFSTCSSRFVRAGLLRVVRGVCPAEHRRGGCARCVLESGSVVDAARAHSPLTRRPCRCYVSAPRSMYRCSRTACGSLCNWEWWGWGVQLAIDSWLAWIFST